MNKSTENGSICFDIYPTYTASLYTVLTCYMFNDVHIAMKHGCTLSFAHFTNPSPEVGHTAPQIPAILSDYLKHGVGNNRTLRKEVVRDSTTTLSKHTFSRHSSAR